MVSKPQLLHFVLLRSFDASAEGLLDDDDLATLQGILNADPRAGRVITGTGGLRKLRVAASGRGKRGGGRVVYLYVEVRSRVFLMAVFPKSEVPDLTPAEYRKLTKLVERLKMEE